MLYEDSSLTYHCSRALQMNFTHRTDETLKNEPQNKLILMKKIKRVKCVCMGKRQEWSGKCNILNQHDIETCYSRAK